MREATGISDDGLTIVGYGTNPDGYHEGWIATIPACRYALAGDMNYDCRVDFQDLAKMANNWLTDCSINPACVPNFLDFAKMATNWLIDCSINPDDPACVPK